jgi:hypothetical protein
MSEPKLPAGWDAARAQRLIDYYESLPEEEQVAEDEAGAAEQDGSGSGPCA